MDYSLVSNLTAVQVENSLIMQICALFSAVILAYFAFKKDDKTIFSQTLEALHSENIKLKQEVLLLKDEVFKLRAELESTKRENGILENKDTP